MTACSVNHADISTCAWRKRLFPRGGERSVGNPELIAHHFDQAGNAEQAVLYWLKAGEVSIQSAALNEAADHLTSGLALIEAISDPSLRAKTELSLQAALGPTLRAIRGSGNQASLPGLKDMAPLIFPTASLRSYLPESWRPGVR